MPITLGDTSITGLGVGGLPAGTVNATTLADSAVTRAKMGYAGAVLQVVSGYNNAKVRATGSSYLWQNAAVITPSSATSKILVIAQFSFGRCNLNGAVKMLRNDNTFMPNLVSAYIGGSTSAEGAFNTSDDTMGASNDYEINSYPVFFLDSPNTTQQLSYGLYYYLAPGSSGFVTFNRQEIDNGGNACSTVQLMEITT